MGALRSLQRPVAVISIDIDHFKQVNDSHGHSAGDLVLKRVAGVLCECVRTTDNVCRIGGEEFLIILPCQTTQEAEVCAQRCRKAVSELTFDFGGQSVRTTISAGISGRQPDMSQSADLLKEADDALYAAKHAGRNAVRTARIDAGVVLAVTPAA